MKVYDEEFSKELIEQYGDLKEDIARRMSEFSGIWEAREPEVILSELFFCILTPQSKATTCWGAVEELTCRDLLLQGTYEEILDVVGVVRFKYRKAGYMIEAREKFIKNGHISLVEVLEGLKDPISAREWLVKEIKGYGYKEASHFLRNIGLGEDLTILDRHILKNLVRAGVIDGIPSSMTEKNYLKIEEKMRAYSNMIGIPLSHLDLLLWYREAGEIFK